MKPIAIVNPDYKDYLSIQYELTNVCNYKCNYCWPESHSGTTRWPDYDIICKNFDHLISVYKNYQNKKTIRFHLIGGEPTLWPRLGDFAKFIYEKHGCRMTMATNGSRTIRWWNENAEYFNDIQLSVHHEFCDVDHVKNVLDAIYNKGTIMTAATVLMDPKAWNKCVGIVDELKSHPVPWMVKTMTLVEADGDETSVIRKDYTSEHIEYMRDKIKRLPPKDYIANMKELGNIEQDKTAAKIILENGTEQPYKTFDLYENKINTFYGWECNIGVDRVAVQANGRIQGSCGELSVYSGKPFYIHDQHFMEEFTPDLIKPAICSRAFCGCTAEIRLPKRKLSV
jgi:sulfatase maturation enzyme AslB (radical SAM superfamily)